MFDHKLKEGRSWYCYTPELQNIKRLLSSRVLDIEYQNPSLRM